MPLTLQALPPHAAKLCLRVEKICRERFHLKHGHKLLLAISGGADSTALALIFHILAPRLGLSLAALHINHSLRAEAEEDAAFSQNLCSELEIPCKIAVADVNKAACENHCGLEEAGRLARLAFLEKEREAIGAHYIVTAHHSGDLAEDLLMRLLRGSAWPQLGGMAWQNGRILHPLLHEKPAKLKSFVTACGKNWREDSSNQNLAFKRNRIRHLLMPMLRCENPSLDRSIQRLHDQADQDSDYWRQEINKALAINPWQLSKLGDTALLCLPKSLLKNIHPALRMRLFAFALDYLRQTLGQKGQNRAETLQNLEKAYTSGIGGKIIQCSGDIAAVCRQGDVLFSSL